MLWHLLDRSISGLVFSSTFALCGTAILLVMNPRILKSSSPYSTSSSSFSPSQSQPSMPLHSHQSPQQYPALFQHAISWWWKVIHFSSDDITHSSTLEHVSTSLSSSSAAATVAASSAASTDKLGHLSLPVIISYETLGVATWIASVLFCSCICFGTVGRRLMVVRAVGGRLDGRVVAQ